jgi:cell division protein FtsW (lipid II flippase)
MSNKQFELIISIVVFIGVMIGFGIYNAYKNNKNKEKMTNPAKFVYDNWKWVLIFTVIYFLWAVKTNRL